MKRRHVLIGAMGLGLAAGIGAGPAAAQAIPLGELSRYLNDLTTLQSSFTQVNDDGTIDRGTVYIRRPGRVRFEYDPPDDTLVMAGGSQVAVFDGGSNLSRPEQYPLSRTPLSIILAPNVSLGQAQMVQGHSFDGTATTVIAQDPRNPEYGHIEMKFTANPTELRQWVVVDAAGARTTVILGEVETGASLGARLFDIAAETRSRGG